MSTIADSSAFRDDDRSLPQHQAFITLLQPRIARASDSVRWLDLACGRGQIMVGIRGIDDSARSRIDYFGYDVRLEFTQETEKTTRNLGLRSFAFELGQLLTFSRSYPPDARFDFISLTNAVHELSPLDLPAIIVDCLNRLTDNGIMYVYDMETLSPRELGAVTWSSEEIRRIFKVLCDSLGVKGYEPSIARWPHRTCYGWSAQLQRDLLGVATADLLSKSQGTKEKLRDIITRLLSDKLERCRKSLEALTRFHAETTEESQEKERLLYDYWAISRVVEATK